VARDVASELRSADPEANVEVEIGSDLAVDGDARLVSLLLANLLGNAWKFTRNEEHARIMIGKEVVSGETRLFVRDNGVGFDMIYAHRLFGAFQRLHSHSEFPGEGIGLATAQRIVNRHGGRIWAEGAVGEGAAFFFVL
jgi:light-regulated signal transduction histidine kinase (bacteriophytochrome)